MSVYAEDFTVSSAYDEMKSKGESRDILLI